jgi:hypothetical protein
MKTIEARIKMSIRATFTSRSICLSTFGESGPSASTSEVGMKYLVASQSTWRAKRAIAPGSLARLMSSAKIVTMIAPPIQAE